MHILWWLFIYCSIHTWFIIIYLWIVSYFPTKYSPPQKSLEKYASSLSIRARKLEYLCIIWLERHRIIIFSYNFIYWLLSFKARHKILLSCRRHQLRKRSWRACRTGRRRGASRHCDCTTLGGAGTSSWRRTRMEPRPPLLQDNADNLTADSAASMPLWWANHSALLLLWHWSSKWHGTGDFLETLALCIRSPEFRP